MGLLGCANDAPEDPLEEIRELQATGQIEESIPKLIELIESGNRDAEVLYRYGRARSLTGNPNRAVWALDAALDDPEWLVRASHQLALDAYRSQNFELTLDILERLKEERTDDPDADMPAKMLEARALVQSRRRYDEAIELLDAILEDDPENELAIRLKAVSLLNMKQPDEAYALIRAAAGEPDGAPEDGASEAEAPEDTGASAGVEMENAEAMVTSRGEAEDPLAAAMPDGTSNGGDEDEDGEGMLSLDVDADRREPYWCAVRISFKREAGEPDAARTIADECLERFPSDPGLLDEAIKLYAKAGPFERVAEVLEAAVEDAPENDDLRMALVQHYDALGRDDDAVALLRSAVETAEEEREEKPVRAASRWVSLGSFLIDHGDVSEGLEALEAAVGILGEHASPELLFRQAEALILTERYDEALEIAEGTPIEVHGPMIRGRVAFEREDFERAIEELETAARLWPNNAPIRYYLARSAEAVGDFDRAIEEYRQALRADPALSAPRERLARLHLAESRVREAATILHFASPKRASGEKTTDQRLLWIEVQTRLGRAADFNLPPDPELSADELLREMIRAAGRGLRDRPDAENAAAILGQLQTRLAPVARGVVARERVDVLVEQGRAEEALEVVRTATRNLPDSLDLRIAVADALSAEGSQMDKAEQAIAHVLEAAPENVDGLKIAARIDRMLERPERAAERLDAALAVAPDDWEALSARVELLREAGKADEAIRRLERFLAVDGPYEGEAALALARLLDAEADRERRLALARRAVRFGAGAEALALLESLGNDVSVAS